MRFSQASVRMIAPERFPAGLTSETREHIANARLDIPIIGADHVPSPNPDTRTRIDTQSTDQTPPNLEFKGHAAFPTSPQSICHTPCTMVHHRSAQIELTCPMRPREADGLARGITADRDLVLEYPE